MAMHPKILELRNKVGSSPILYSNRFNPIKHSFETRVSSKRTQISPDGRILRQYFAIWGIPDDYGTVPIKGCFTKSINDRGPKSKATYKITALYMHSQADSVGMPVVLEEDEIGLYAEVDIMEGVQVADELMIRHKSGTCNNGSYGFNYVWDMMEYDSTLDAVLMMESNLFELSFVTIGSQQETFGVRSKEGIYTDPFLTEETEDLIRRLPRKEHLELRSLIDRHITLAKNEPLELRQKALEITKPQHEGNMLEMYNYLIENI